jgi:hypothetical protein
MIRRFLLWLTARLPVRVIGRPGSPYVEWYHVCTPFGLFRVQLHRFLRSDPDGLHDHPWGWAFSLILAGWYIEERRDRDRVRSRGYFIRGDTFHRVVLPQGGEVWTLFVHGPYVKHWGFMTPFFDGPPAPTWHDREGSQWFYEARDRHHDRFDDWPWRQDTPRGRDIREAA